MIENNKRYNNLSSKTYASVFHDYLLRSQHMSLTERLDFILDSDEIKDTLERFGVDISKVKDAQRDLLQDLLNDEHERWVKEQEDSEKETEEILSNPELMKELRESLTDEREGRLVSLEELTKKH